jgi:hypothetical protein
MTDPTPADFTSDLAALEHRQSLLHAALAHVHALGACAIGEHGLAIYHRLAVLNGQHSIEAVLVHAAGGEISSGFLPVDPADHAAIRQTQKLTSQILLGGLLPVDPSTPQESQSPVVWPNPCPVPAAKPSQQEPPAAAVEADPHPEHAPAAPTPDDPPSKEAIEALIADLDRVFNRRPTRVKELTAAFRAAFEIGPKTPVARSITTRGRADWLRTRIDEAITEIAEFDQAQAEGVTP